MAVVEQLVSKSAIIEVTRGDMVESRHRGRFAVVDARGKVVMSAGDLEQAIYARSAIKPLQALVLVESGAAAAFGLGNAELSLACASHNGEPRHTETVQAWLRKIGCHISDLECAAHLPYDETAAKAMLRADQQPTAAHNNCSGKHSGFLSYCRHQGIDTKGYIEFAHPVQQRVLGVLEMMCGLDLSKAPRGIDGCGIPVIGIPLGNLALAMARFADPWDQPEARQQACARLYQAIRQEPFMIAGSGRFCSRVITETNGRVIVKTGAEGVFCAALPDHGLGIALKVEDGATRAAEALMAGLLRQLGVVGEQDAVRLADAFNPEIKNRAGRVVGALRLATGSFDQ